MKKKISLDIKKQPDNTTCGPTSLHAVYEYWEDGIDLNTCIKEIKQFEQGGGTLSVILGNHALSRGYRATMHSYNMAVFDPTWKNLAPELLREKLRLQLEQKPNDEKLATASHAYISFLENGGKLVFEELNRTLIQRYLIAEQPILAGLSATYLYQSAREIPETTEYDELKGSPSGHFVVIYGFDAGTDEVLIADPYIPNPVANQHYYSIKMDRLIASILLGVVTYDGNLLILSPTENS
jgi:hypothetical protein